MRSTGDINDSGEIFYDYIEDNLVNSEKSFEKLPLQFNGNNEEWDKLSINESQKWSIRPKAFLCPISKFLIFF